MNFFAWTAHATPTWPTACAQDRTCWPSEPSSVVPSPQMIWPLGCTSLLDLKNFIGSWYHTRRSPIMLIDMIELQRSPHRYKSESSFRKLIVLRYPKLEVQLKHPLASPIVSRRNQHRSFACTICQNSLRRIALSEKFFQLYHFLTQLFYTGDVQAHHPRHPHHRPLLTVPASFSTPLALIDLDCSTTSF